MSVTSKLARRVVLDLLPGSIAWAVSQDTFRGPSILESNCQRLSDSEDALEEVAHLLPLAERPRPQVDAVLPNVVEVDIQRIDLADVSPREARGVARRKVAELLQQGEPGSLEASSLVSGDPSGSSLWLFSASSDACAEANDFFSSHELSPDRLVPQGFATAALVAALPPVDDGLTAFLWIEDSLASCIIADRRGWLFARDIQVRRTHGSVLTAETQDAEEDQEVGALVRDEAVQRADWLATEIQRTFLYVDRQLRLGEVTRLVLCGDEESLPSLKDRLRQELDTPVDWLGSGVGGSPTHSLRPTEAACAGIALLPRSIRDANLLPKTVRASKLYDRARGHLVAALIALSILVVGVGGLDVVRYHAVSSNLETVRAQVERSQPHRRELADAHGMRERLDNLIELRTELDRPEPAWSTTFDLLGRVAPDPVYLERFETWWTEDGWRMRLIVTADQATQSEIAASVQDYGQRLKSLRLFTVASLEPEQDHPTVVDESGVPRMQYRLEGWVASLSSEESGK